MESYKKTELYKKQISEIEESQKTGCYYNEELGMMINHPHGSDEYWNVYYYHFTKKMYESQYGVGIWQSEWDRLHPNGPSQTEVENNMNMIKTITPT